MSGLSRSKRRIPIIPFVLLLLLGFISVSMVGTANAGSTVVQGMVGNMPGEEQQRKLIDEQVGNLKTQGIQEFMNGLDADTRKVMPEFNLRKLVSAEGIGILDPRRLISLGTAFLAKELIANSRLMGELLIIVILAALLQSVSIAFSNDGPSQVANIICYLILAIICIKSFMVAIGVARDAVMAMSDFMTALIPPLFTLLVALGGVATASLMHPVTVMMTVGVARIVTGFVFPLLFLFAVLGIVGGLSSRMQLSKLAGMAKDLSVVSLGISMTFLTGTMIVKGLAGPGLDGAAMRGTKFLAKVYVPVVGGLFADAWDTVAGCSLLLKNAVGVFGLLGVVGICLIPIIKIASLILVYRVTAAVTQPVADARLTNLLGDLAGSLFVLLGAVAVVGFMYFICLTVIVGLGSVTMMSR